jgi:hypothetical protein
MMALLFDRLRKLPPAETARFRTSLTLFFVHLLSEPQLTQIRLPVFHDAGERRQPLRVMAR